MTLRKRGRTRTFNQPRSIAEILSPELLDDDMVARDELDELLRDPTQLDCSEATSQQQVHDDEHSGPPESRLARYSKLGALLVTVTVLGATLATTAGLHSGIPSIVEGPSVIASEAASAAGGVTGARALIADVVAEAPRQRDTTEDNGVIRTDRTSAQEHPEVDAPQVTDPGTQKETVTKFYDRVQTNPEHALSMLGSELVGSSATTLLQSWQSITHVTVHALHPQDGATIHAIVTMSRSDGNRVRMNHQLHIAAGTEPLITQARLLSAQNSPAPAPESGDS